VDIGFGSPLHGSKGEAEVVGSVQEPAISSAFSSHNQAPTLWPCQVAVVEKVKASIAAGRKRILLTMPTGSGKTVVAAHLMRELGVRGKRLFVAHRQ
jgi:superfamily II DNA or RNA helicase